MCLSVGKRVTTDAPSFVQNSLSVATNHHLKQKDDVMEGRKARVGFMTANPQVLMSMMMGRSFSHTLLHHLMVTMMARKRQDGESSAQKASARKV